MIDRYTRPEMGHIFSLENKYAVWQEIEVLACEAQAELGKIGITKDEAKWIRDHANFEKAKVDEIEEVTRHDVIAFLTNMKEYIDADVPADAPKPSRWVHYGMTSSDLGDTALCYQLTQACDLIIKDVQKLGEICKRRAFEERDTLCAGRTHGIHAEPATIMRISPAFLLPLQPRASVSPPRSATCKRPIPSKPKSLSARARRAAPLCPISATPSPWRRSAAFRAW